MKDARKNFNGYNSILAYRLRQLLESNNANEKTTQEELAKFVKTTRQTISYYQNGITQPSAEKLYYIAEFFKVSTDYLVGQSESKSIKLGNKEVTNSLGLIDNSIKTLRLAKKKKSNSDLICCINTLLEEKSLNTLKLLSEYLNFYKQEISQSTNITEESFRLLQEKKSYLLHEIQKALITLMINIAKEDK